MSKFFVLFWKLTALSFFFVIINCKAKVKDSGREQTDSEAGSVGDNFLTSSSGATYISPTRPVGKATPSPKITMPPQTFPAPTISQSPKATPTATASSSPNPTTQFSVYRIDQAINFITTMAPTDILAQHSTIITQLQPSDMALISSANQVMYPQTDSVGAPTNCRNIPFLQPDPTVQHALGAYHLFRFKPSEIRSQMRFKWRGTAIGNRQLFMAAWVRSGNFWQITDFRDYSGDERSIMVPVDATDGSYNVLVNITMLMGLQFCTDYAEFTLQ